MKPEEIIVSLTEKVEEIRNIIDTELPDKGAKCVDSQKICLLLTLNSFEANIIGLEAEDFKK